MLGQSEWFNYFLQHIAFRSLNAAVIHMYSAVLLLIFNILHFFYGPYKQIEQLLTGSTLLTLLNIFYSFA